jgi:hypothetical protein
MVNEPALLKLAISTWGSAAKLAKPRRVVANKQADINFIKTPAAIGRSPATLTFAGIAVKLDFSSTGTGWHWQLNKEDNLQPHVLSRMEIENKG